MDMINIFKKRLVDWTFWYIKKTFLGKYATITLGNSKNTLNIYLLTII